MYVGATLCGVVSYQAGKDIYEIKCGDGIIGDYVKIVQNNNYLTLAEVQAYGFASGSAGFELSGSTNSGNISEIENLLISGTILIEIK